MSDGDESDDEFFIDKQDTKVWLVKVPTFVAEKWQEASEANPGTELGSVRIYDNTQNVTLTIPEVEWAAELPKKYNLRFTNLTPLNEFVFKENSAGKAVELAGKVEHEATVGPVMDDEYHEILKRRTAAASVSSRVIKKVLDKRTEAKIRATGTESTWSALKKSKKSAEKRERMPRNELLNILFQQFAEYRYWNFKGISERTQQPQAWLKEILEEVCILNKRGPYTGMYELKPEFRQTTT